MHRDRAIYPANSLESVIYAVDVLNTDGVEIDVRLTKDSVLMCYHDVSLDETTDLSGCISEFTYQELKNTTIDNTEIQIATLKDILVFCESRQTKVYIDLKPNSVCQGTASVSAFQYGLNQATNSLSETYIQSQLMIGYLSDSYLNQLDFPNKCYESSSVEDAILKQALYTYSAVLFNKNVLTLEDKNTLNQNGIKWGVFSVKDKWSIDEMVENEPPTFVITDNIAYTMQVTK